jgi:hypothetical protein
MLAGRVSRVACALLGALLAMVGVAACGAGGATAQSSTPAATASATAPPSSPTQSSGPVQRTDALVFPDYAYPFSPATAPFGATRKDGIEVTYYEIGRAVTNRDSTFRDRETGKNVWPAGFPAVYFEMVVTNVGDRRTYIAVAGPHPLVTLKSLDYLGGVSNLTTFDTGTAASFGAHQYGIKTEGYDWAKGDHFPFEPGQSVAQAAVLPLRTGETYRFSLGLQIYDKVEKTGSGHTIYFEAFTTVFL